MKRLSIIVLCVAALFVFGCASSEVRYTHDEIKGYPLEIQEHITKGEVVPGMSPQQVRFAWGAPDTTKVLSPVEDKPREEWAYSSGLGMFKTRIIFQEGKVVSIVSSEPGKIK